MRGRAFISSGELLEQITRTEPTCKPPEVGESAGHLIIEIAARHLRITVHRASEIATDVAAILTQQRAGVILRMPLEEDESGATTQYECVRSGLIGQRDELVTCRSETLGIERVEARMR